MKIFLIFVFVAFSITAQAKSELDSLLSVLDKTILDRKSYEVERENRIGKLKQEYNLSKSAKEQCRANLST